LARHCIRNAREARARGWEDRALLYLRCVRMLRMAAAQWRQRAKALTGVRP
jgi:hypothetical protein